MHNHKRKADAVTNPIYSWRQLIVTAAVSAIVAYATTYVAQRLFPTVQLTRQLPPADAEFHLKKLREDCPPFPYKIELIQAIPASTFLGLQTQAPIYTYSISLANLTETPVNNVSITIKYHRTAERFFLRPLWDCVLTSAPGKSIPKNETVTLQPTREPFTYQLAQLPPTTCSQFLFAVCTDAQPSLKDIALDIECPEGRFCQLTPIQWNRIGWK
ncbi:MAG: hypothetical protein ABFD92_07995 [Planctomycetaceae bacterium]|nr:hypothetical protein [Planctomycetaceae bacterium]